MHIYVRFIANAMVVNIESGLVLLCWMHPEIY